MQPNNNEAKTFLEPIINNDKYCYLKVTRKKIFPARPVKEILNNTPEPPTFETTFEIVDESLWSCNRCGATIQSNPEKPEHCTACDRASSFKPVTETINRNLWKIPKYTPVEDLPMLLIYTDLLKLIKSLAILPDEIYYKMFALWLISQYKLERWNSVSFWIFRGLPNSGKTRLLELIYQLGYRAVQTSSTTFSAMCRLTHYNNATVLVDEADSNLSSETEEGQEFLRFVRSSYRKGSVYTTADKNDQKAVFSYKNFGFKAFAAEKAFNPALLTRSVVIDMEKDYPEFTSLQYIQDQLDDIQNKLFNYRFRTDDPPDLGENFPLRGREREIFESIIGTAMHIGLEYQDIIEFSQEHELEEEENLKESIENEILVAVKDLAEVGTLLDAPETIKITDIFSKTSYATIDDEKERRKKRQTIGYKLKNMGLKTKKTNEGSVLLFNHPKNLRRLKYLWKRYKI